MPRTTLCVTLAFKYLESVSEAELVRVASLRLGRAGLVVATRGEDTRGSEQRALMVGAAGVTALEGKRGIAAHVADHLEALASQQPLAQEGAVER